MGKYLIAKTARALHFKLLGMRPRRIEIDLHYCSKYLCP